MKARVSVLLLLSLLTLSTCAGAQASALQGSLKHFIYNVGQKNTKVLGSTCAAMSGIMGAGLIEKVGRLLISQGAKSSLVSRASQYQAILKTLLEKDHALSVIIIQYEMHKQHQSKLHALKKQDAAVLHKMIVTINHLKQLALNKNKLLVTKKVKHLSWYTSDLGSAIALLDGAKKALMFYIS